MKNLIKTFGSIMALCLATSFSFGQDDYKQEVTKLMNNFVQLWNTDDTTALRSLLSDKIVLAKNHSHLSGIDAIMKEYITKQVSNTRDFTVLKVDEMDVIGSMAMQSGQWTASTNDGSQKMGGEYTLMWKKEGEAWKLKTLHLEEK